jgi:hypothetical protein
MKQLRSGEHILKSLFSNVCTGMHFLHIIPGLLTKQAVREKKMLLYTKNTFILKLLLNIVTAGTEAFVSGNKFL